MKTIINTLAVAALGLSVSFSTLGQEKIRIEKPANYAIPVCLKGFTGEVESVLRFDLYVLGMDITTADRAEYIVAGKNTDHVEGNLSTTGIAGLSGRDERGGHMSAPASTSSYLFSRTYSGGNLRVQAHSLAEDVVAAVRKTPPIFRSKIAYRAGNDSNAEIIMADFDGNHPITLTHDRALVGGASWVPGGHILLYTTWMSGVPNIIEHEISSGMRKNLIKPVGSAYGASVSPDGRKVAMTLNRSGNPDLWVCDISGSNLRQLTTTKTGAESCPCWSSDSREICYVYDAGRPALFKINAASGASERLRTAGAYGSITDPDWSPNGEKIIFTAGGGNDHSLFAVPANGGEAEQLVAGEDASWAPNSRTVIFMRRVNGKHVLSLLDVPTKHVKDILQISGNCSQPCWAR